MKKKKLLITAPYFYPHSGGLENYVFNIALGLLKKKWEIVVVTSNHVNKKRVVEKIRGIKIYRLPTMLRISNTPINPFWYQELRHIIKTESPDLINSHSPVPFMLNITAISVGKIPFVITYHSGTMKKGKLQTDILLFMYEKFFLRIAVRKADKIICSSNFVKRTMFGNYKEKCVVINPGVDIDIFKPKKNKKPAKDVLFVARHANMYRLKGLDYLVEAINGIPDAKLKIVGEKIKNSNKKVEFLGLRSGNGLAREIQTSSMVVLPSLAHMESFGMVLVEAMACKIPVVGTRIGGIPEIIDNNKNGFIVSPKNSKELSKAISSILTDDKLAIKFGENGYRKVMRRYLWQFKTNETNRLFLKLLNE